MRKRIEFPREVLLVEVERRCLDPSCNARVRLGVTKAEARVYTGFACERCERWNDDVLSERDIPEWWEELRLTALDGIRPVAANQSEASEIVERMSEAWRSIDEQGRSGASDDNEDETSS